jgi:hypothetical protein
MTQASGKVSGKVSRKLTNSLRLTTMVTASLREANVLQTGGYVMPSLNAATSVAKEEQHATTTIRLTTTMD